MDKLPLAQRKSRLRALCGISISVILAGTLWPYNFFPPNRVSWLVGAKGIDFKRAGVVVSDQPWKSRSSDPSQPCSLELLVRPAGMQFGKTIVGFHAHNNPRQFQLEQAGKVLGISREFLDAFGRPKLSRLGVDEIFAQGQLVLIAITSGPHGTIVYKNGRRADSFSRVRISPEDLSGQIVLGTSPSKYDPWEGELRGLALYAKEVTPEQELNHYLNWTVGGAEFSEQDGAIAYYAFVEGAGRNVHNAVIGGPGLQIPRVFRVPYKPLLESPLKEFELGPHPDVFRNIVMFVPVGYLFCAYWMLTQGSRQAIRRAILVAGLLSLVIEILQAYIPIRFSGITDVLTNTLGASLGAVLAQRRWCAGRGPSDSWNENVGQRGQAM